MSESIKTDQDKRLSVLQAAFIWDGTGSTFRKVFEDDKDRRPKDGYYVIKNIGTDDEAAAKRKIAKLQKTLEDALGIEPHKDGNHLFATCRDATKGAEAALGKKVDLHVSEQFLDALAAHVGIKKGYEHGDANDYKEKLEEIRDIVASAGCHRVNSR